MFELDSSEQHRLHLSGNPELLDESNFAKPGMCKSLMIPQNGLFDSKDGLIAMEEWKLIICDFVVCVFRICQSVSSASISFFGVVIAPTPCELVNFILCSFAFLKFSCHTLEVHRYVAPNHCW